MPKVSNIAQPFSSLASSKIRLTFTSVSSGPSRDSNSSIYTFKLFLSSKYCFVFAMTVLSDALHIWSSSSRCSCSSSHDEYEFCNGVGGIILLDSGGAFTCGPSKPHFFLRNCTRVSTLFWRKRTAVPQMPTPCNRRNYHKTQ